jgi:hypothetical protein
VEKPQGWRASLALLLRFPHLGNQHGKLDCFGLGARGMTRWKSRKAARRALRYLILRASGTADMVIRIRFGRAAYKIIRIPMARAAQTTARWKSRKAGKRALRYRFPPGRGIVRWPSPTTHRYDPAGSGWTPASARVTTKGAGMTTWAPPSARSGRALRAGDSEECSARGGGGEA